MNNRQYKSGHESVMLSFVCLVSGFLFLLPSSMICISKERFEGRFACGLCVPGLEARGPGYSVHYS